MDQLVIEPGFSPGGQPGQPPGNQPLQGLAQQEADQDDQQSQRKWVVLEKFPDRPSDFRQIIHWSNINGEGFGNLRDWLFVHRRWWGACLNTIHAGSSVNARLPTPSIRHST